MLQSACQASNGTIQKLEPNVEMSRPHACFAPQWTAGYLNIFGMHQLCQPDTVRTVDAQQLLNATTSERIRTMLPKVLQLMQWEPQQEQHNSPHPPDRRLLYVQVGSNLWDLSQGCNHQVGISTEYEHDYRMGIGEVTKAIHRTVQEYYAAAAASSDITTNAPVVPDSTSRLIWKLAAPVSLKYSREMEQQGFGRTRENQQRLNEILRQEVVMLSSQQEQQQQDKGDVQMVDWWDIVMRHKQSEQALNMELKKDGRHYSECPSLVFFNALLEKIHIAIGIAGDIT